MSFQIHDNLIHSDRQIGAERVRIGKAVDNDIHINEKGIRDYHAQFERTARGFVLTNSEPKAIVLYKGQSVREVSIEGPCEFKIGSFIIKAHVIQSAHSETGGAKLPIGSDDKADLDAEAAVFGAAPAAAPQVLYIEVIRPHGLKHMEWQSAGAPDSADLHPEKYFYNDGKARLKRLKLRLAGGLAAIVGILVLVGVLIYPENGVTYGGKGDPHAYLKIHSFPAEGCLKPPCAKTGDARQTQFINLYSTESCATCHSGPLDMADESLRCGACHLKTVALGASPQKTGECRQCHLEHRAEDPTAKIKRGEWLLAGIKRQDDWKSIFEDSFAFLRFQIQWQAGLVVDQAARSKAQAGSNADAAAEASGAGVSPNENKGTAGPGVIARLKGWLRTNLNPYVPLPVTFDKSSPLHARGSCFDCHENGRLAVIHKANTKHLSRPRWELKFPHDTHEEAEPNCAACHQAEAVTTRKTTLSNCFDCHNDPIDDEQGLYCGQCHRYHHGVSPDLKSLESRLGRAIAAVYKEDIPPEPTFPARRKIEQSEADALIEKGLPPGKEPYPGAFADQAAAAAKAKAAVQGQPPPAEDWGDELKEIKK